MYVLMALSLTIGRPLLASSQAGSERGTMPASPLARYTDIPRAKVHTSTQGSTAHTATKPARGQK